MAFDVELSGDVAAVVTMPKQLVFAIADSLTKTAKRAQKEIPPELERVFTVRGDWYLPSRKNGIRIKFAKKTDLEAAVYTMADWLLEAEGYHGGVKTPDKGGTNLAEPDVEHTRHGIRNKIARAEKARLLLQNAKRTHAFKIKGKYGGQLIFQRIGLGADGKPNLTKAGRYSNRRKRGQKSALVLKYVLRKSVRVPYHPVVTGTTIIVFRDHYGNYLNASFAAALRNAKR
jgi:hypothetical protein